MPAILTVPAPSSRAIGRSLRQAFGSPTYGFPASRPGRTNWPVRVSLFRMLAAGAPSGLTLLPVLLSLRRKQRPGISTSSHRRVSISPRRHPVSANRRTAAIACHDSMSSSAFAKAAPSVRYCSRERRTLRRSSAARLTPRTGFVAMTPSDTAKLIMPPSSPTVRVAAPLPPSTIARPNLRVLTSAVVFPTVTSR